MIDHDKIDCTLRYYRINDITYVSVKIEDTDGTIDYLLKIDHELHDVKATFSKTGIMPGKESFGKFIDRILPLVQQIIAGSLLLVEDDE